MLVVLLSLCCFLLMLHVVLPACEVSVRTIDFGCHLDWECPDANPNTTYTVQSKAHGLSWENVLGCIQITRHSCDLSNVFTNLNNYNYIRLSSEHQDLINETFCDPINNDIATFSPPSVNISMENRSLWVTVNLPCAHSMSCRFVEDEDEDKAEVETLCPCPITYFTSLSATVMLYNKRKPSYIQIRSAEIVDEKAFREEFGFVISGQVYCAVANFTSEGPLVRTASPPSLPRCIYIPAKTESLIAVVVCAVLIALGLVVYFLWRRCAFPEPPLPKALALLYDQELQNATVIDSSKTASDRRSSVSDRISVVSLSVFTHVDNQSYYHSSQSLGNGYYRSPVLEDPGYNEESSGGLTVLSGGLETDGTHCFELLQTAHLIFREERCPYLDECDKILKIPLSSVRVKLTEQEETTTEHYGDVTDNIQEDTEGVEVCGMNLKRDL